MEEQCEKLGRRWILQGPLTHVKMSGIYFKIKRKLLKNIMQNHNVTKFIFLKMIPAVR